MAIPTKVKIMSLEVPATLRATGPQMVTTKRMFMVITNPNPPDTKSRAQRPRFGFGPVKMSKRVQKSPDCIVKNSMIGSPRQAK